MMNINAIKILLASNSPRRKDILEQAGIPFRLFSKEVKEEYPGFMPAKQVPEFLAKLKAQAVLDQLQPGEIILAADTVVAKNEIIYGKPAGRDDAIEILTELSGSSHDVITGVCLLTKEKEKVFSAKTSVYFNSLSKNEIIHYIDTFHPFDKAGAYAIQEWIGLIGISKIEGCYFNVVGLPMSRVYEELATF